ncbi:interleukin-1 receptor type 2 [Amia ocellicauda]|uniref:interleukin-1 receptor type 2 n=1 Tax=Amia ocellicauda TaxID=2972642 RepID=UPI0034646384
MQQQRGASAAAGPGTMRLVVTVALWGTLCLLLVESRTVRPPKIKAPKPGLIQATPGTSLTVSCTADPGFPDDFVVIYWLVNSTFIETAFPKGRVKEGEEKTYTINNEAFIQRNLTFSPTHNKDFKNIFTCVVNNAAGLAKVDIRLSKKSRKGKKSAGQSRKLKINDIMRRNMI